jgi:hypothetical protein
MQNALAAENAALSNAAARRAMGPSGMYPPMVRPMGGDDDKRRNNRLPSVDTGLFSLDERTSSAVIGELTDRERNIGL